METDERSTDYWRISVDSVGGKSTAPPALVNLEVRIARRIVIPTDLLSGGDSGIEMALKGLGLNDVLKLSEAVRAMTAEVRSFINTGWMMAPGGQFSAKSLAALSVASERKVTWKVEGDFNPGGTSYGVINCGGYEIRFPVTEESIDRIEAQAIQMKLDAEAVIRSPTSSRAEREAAGVALDAALCVVGAGAVIGGLRDPLTILGTIKSCYDATKAIKDAIDEATKRAAEAAEKAQQRAGQNDSSSGAEEGFRKVGKDLYQG